MKIPRVFQRVPICLFFCVAFVAPVLRAQSNAGSAVEKSGFDGPAELPRVYVKSSLADTPSPGKALEVKEGDNLQEALNRAACGDIVRLQAGAEFRGTFRLPAKQCDDAHWITIRTSAADSDLPAEGSRIFPCYAGVESLADRPAFKCTSNKNVMAKIAFSPPRAAADRSNCSGANHYRFIRNRNHPSARRHCLQPGFDGKGWSSRSHHLRPGLDAWDRGRRNHARHHALRSYLRRSC